MTAYEEDYRRTVKHMPASGFLDGTSIELIRRARRPHPPRQVLFDFDGTLSLIREGWQEVMIPMMVEVLAATGTGETPEGLHRLADDFVTKLTGKQTIYQMIQLSEEVAARGGKPLDPLEYKKIYHDRLMERIRHRRDALRSGEVLPRDMLVPYSCEMLQALRERGVSLYLASGTDRKYVLEEARLLGLEEWFGPHIYGAIEDYRNYSKAMVIERILRENSVDGKTLVGFGDGYVEIQNVKEAGGVAVAVASNERARDGTVNQWKRDRLIGIGADVVIPDYGDFRALLAYLWGESPQQAGRQPPEPGALTRE